MILHVKDMSGYDPTLNTIFTAPRLFMVAISIDGPGVSPSPVFDGFWRAAAHSILIFLSIYVLFFAVKKPFCCILQTVLDLAVPAFPGKKRSS